MLSRRTLIGKAAVGAAAALVVGTARTGAAATRPLRAAADDPQAAPDAPAATLDAQAAPQVDAAEVAAPAPWALVAPYGAGAALAHGWHLAALTAVQDGSAVATLQNARGHAHRVHLCGNDGTPQGLVATRRVDLVVMNQGYGDLPTDEHLGKAVATLAQAIAANEAQLADGIFAGLLPHAARVERFAAVEGPTADGKLR